MENFLTAFFYSLTSRVYMLNFFDNLKESVSSIFDNGWAALYQKISTPTVNAVLNTVKFLYEGATNSLEIQNFVNLDNGAYTSLKGMAEAVYTGVSAIGVGLCILIWFISLVEKLTKDQLSAYVLIKSFISLIFALTVVMSGFEFFVKLADAGTDLCTMIVNAVTTAKKNGLTTVPYESFFFGLSESEMRVGGIVAALTTGVLGILLAFVYFVFMILIVQTLCVATCISRAIQLYVYIAMAPIGICQMFNKGGILDSSAMTYIKKILALVLQGPIMILIIKMSSTIQTGSAIGSKEGLLSAVASGASNALLAIPLLFAVGFVTLTLTMKSQQIANDIIV